MRDKTREVSPKLWDAIYSDLRCRNGVLEAASGANVEAWHAVTGKIPILWTEEVLKAGVERSVYAKWLRWYGKEVREGLWWPLLKARRLQRVASGGDDCNAGEAAAEDSGSESSGGASEMDGD